jgi:sporulation protein YlmC with PRC-barrel domain
VTEGDPVSWLVVEPGWKVVDAEGNEVGQVEEVEGDPNADIFNGLIISTGLLGGRRYVPAEQTSLITVGRVHLRLTNDEVKNLTDAPAPS